MKELLRGDSTISLEAAVLKCPNAKLYLLPFLNCKSHLIQGSEVHSMFCRLLLNKLEHKREIYDTKCKANYLTLCPAKRQI
jgi:hypothetical protein